MTLTSALYAGEVFHNRLRPKAHKLRYRVFSEEMGASFSQDGAVADRDEDCFDAICDHLIVLDTTLPGCAADQIVGTYRLLRDEIAKHAGGFYSAGEYAIDALVSRHRGKRFLELGRSCVMPVYRSKRTIELLWQGIWAYCLRHEIDVMVGCASFPGAVAQMHALPLSFLFQHARAASEWAVDPATHDAVPMDMMPEEAIDMKAALVAAGYEGSPGNFEVTNDATKIAALQVEESKSDAARADAVQLAGDLVQGGLVAGQTLPGSSVTLDGRNVVVDADGRFIIGFNRDHADSAVLEVKMPDGSQRTRVLAVAPREFPTQRIDNLPDNKVSTFTAEEVKLIEASTAKKQAARAKPSPRTAYWANGWFKWPVTGPISGVYGSQRILNGEAKTPHSGVDVAAPPGTTIHAPADGGVTLAETDM